MTIENLSFCLTRSGTLIVRMSPFFASSTLMPFTNSPSGINSITPVVAQIMSTVCPALILLDSIITSATLTFG